MCLLQYSDAFANLSNIPLSFCAAIAVAKKIPKDAVFKKSYNNLIPSMNGHFQNWSVGGEFDKGMTSLLSILRWILVNTWED